MATFTLHFGIIALCLVFVNCQSSAPPTAVPSSKPEPEPVTEIPDKSIQLPKAPSQGIDHNPGEGTQPPPPASQKSEEVLPTSPPKHHTSGGVVPEQSSPPKEDTSRPPTGPPPIGKADKSGGMALSMSLPLSLLALGLLLCRI